VRDSVKRLVPIFVLLALAAVLVAGCGGGGDSDPGKSPAEASPPDASVFVEASIHPSGEAADNIDALAQKIAGVDNVGGLLVEELEREAKEEGEEFDFEKEVEPWLGEKAGIFLRGYDGENFKAIGAAAQVEDEGEAESFIEDHADEDEGKLEEGSYEGVDFKQMEDGTTFGFTEGLLLFGQREGNFKEAVDALDGENLASQDKFTEAADEAPDGSIATVYTDIGGLIEEAGEQIPPETQAGFELMGIEPKGSTALISLVPNSDSIEMDVSSNLGTGTATGGDASDLLGSLPAGSVFAAATPEFGKSIEQVVDTLDEQGIPGEVPPHQFKKALSQSGVDIESILGSLGGLGFFVEGNSEQNIGGAVVIESTNSSEASNTVKNLGLLLRSSGTPGVTAFNENGASGFSIPNDELGGKPIVIAVAGGKIAIGLGPKSVAAALSGKAGTLADDADFKAAKSALGSTPISAYVSGKSALTLIEAVTSPLEQEELVEVKPYLEKMSYLAIGAASSGDQSSAKLILGVTE
jgi:hypothetical protein